MALNIWIGFTRGLLLGLLGGVVAGMVEAASIIMDAPSGRSAVWEAGLYALVVDGLACAALSAVAGAVLAILHRLTGDRLLPRTVAGLHVSVAAGTVLGLAGLLWAFQANGADREAGVPTGTALAILLVARVTQPRRKSKP